MAAVRAWGDGSTWQLFRRLQQAADPTYARTYPTLLAYWTARDALVRERQRRLDTGVHDWLAMIRHVD